MALSAIRLASNTKFEPLKVVIAVITHVVRVVRGRCGVNRVNRVSGVLIFNKTIEVIRVLAHAIDYIEVTSTIGLAIFFLKKSESGVACSADSLSGALATEMRTLITFLFHSIPLIAVSALDAGLSVFVYLVILAMAQAVISQIPGPVVALGASTIRVFSLATHDTTLEIAVAGNSGRARAQLLPGSVFSDRDQHIKFFLGEVTELVVGERHFGGVEVPN